MVMAWFRGKQQAGLTGSAQDLGARHFTPLKAQCATSAGVGRVPRYAEILALHTVDSALWGMFVHGYLHRLGI